jgi:hypothetical protein
VNGHKIIGQSRRCGATLNQVLEALFDRGRQEAFGVKRVTLSQPVRHGLDFLNFVLA